MRARRSVEQTFPVASDGVQPRTNGDEYGATIVCRDVRLVATDGMSKTSNSDWQRSTKRTSKYGSTSERTDKLSKAQIYWTKMDRRPRAVHKLASEQLPMEPRNGNAKPAHGSSHDGTGRHDGTNSVYGGHADRSQQSISVNTDNTEHAKHFNSNGESGKERDRRAQQKSLRNSML